MTRARTLHFLQTYAVLILIGVLIVVLSLSSENFLTTRNLLNILNQNAPLAIMASAMTLVIIVGGFDLSVGGNLRRGVRHRGPGLRVNVDPYLGLLLAPPFVGLLFGIANGVVITALKVHSFLATIGDGPYLQGHRHRCL